jgi:hypothetical protein
MEIMIMKVCQGLTIMIASLIVLSKMKKTKRIMG